MKRDSNKSIKIYIKKSQSELKPAVRHKCLYSHVNNNNELINISTLPFINIKSNSKYINKPIKKCN